ncbi:MAG TPA: SGNH/GDSL hydrolase family protein [Nitrospiraceae bacterium]|nr:SGNH/GDSL hydrolase family protein [Nitrospiraceae bacterium]
MSNQPWNDRHKILVLCVLACTLLAGGEAFSAAGVPADRAAVRIMPLGDSVTESGNGHPSYRYFLWQRLTADGVRMDFVGSKLSRPEERLDASGFDGHHEGHSGWRTDQVLARISVWALNARPDIVLLHLGHNDLWQGKGPANTLEDLAGILEHLRRVNPRVSILIAQIIPSNSIPMQMTAELNEGIAELALATSTGSSPVIAVDHSTGFHVETMTRDGTHPNDEGERRMADRWYDALRPLLLNGKRMRSTAGARLRPAAQAKSVMADDTSEGIISDQMENKIFPAMAADPLGIPRAHGTIDHRTFPAEKSE